MTLEHDQRAHLAGFVIGDDVQHGHALGGSAEPRSVGQGVMLGLRRQALSRHETLPVRLEGLEKKGVDVRHGLTPGS